MPLEPVKGESYTTALIVGAVWAVAVAVGGMVVGMTSRLTGAKALKTPSGANYYDIVRPGIAPPPPVFVVVWTLLFLLYGAGGVAMILPWIQSAQDATKKISPEETTRLSIGVVLYAAVLALLYAWMPVFANNEQPRQAGYLLIAMVVLMVPLLFIACYSSWFAATLMAPLFGWLIVALVMNAESVWRWIAYTKKDVRNKVEQVVAKVMQVRPGQAIDMGEDASVSGARAAPHTQRSEGHADEAAHAAQVQAAQV